MRNKGSPIIPSPTASVTVLVVLAGFLLFVLSIPEIDRQELLLENTPKIDEIILFSESELEFQGYSGLTKDVLNFADLTLDGSAKFEKTEIASDFELTSSLFKTSNFEFIFVPNYESDTIGHQVTFDVDSVSGFGIIKIYLNGQEIGEFSPTVGQTVNLDLPPSILVQGSNQLKISGKYVGLNPFNNLKITLENLAILEKRHGTELEKTLMFYIQEEVILDSAKVDFFIRELGEGIASPIIIGLNSEEVFRVNSLGSISFQLTTSSIKSGMNMLTFTIDKGNAFEVLFPKITTYTSRESAVKSYQFNIDQTEARLVTDGRASCGLILMSNDEDPSLDLVINGFSKSIEIGGNVYEEDICDNLVYGTNRISMSASEAFDLDEITIKLY